MEGQNDSRVRANDGKVRALVLAAREEAGRGRNAESIRLLRQAELTAPHHPLILNETALRLSSTGNYAAAASLLQKAAETEANNAELWFNLGTTLSKMGRDEEALRALDRSLAIDPRNVMALLEKGYLQERCQESRAAAMSYRTALQMIPPGFPAPTWMEERLKHARQMVDANNRALENYLGEALRGIRARFSGESTRRFDACLDIMLQRRRIYRQQPTFMYFPELPAIEFYEREHFPWLDAVEASADDIRAELLDVLSSSSDELDPYVAQHHGMGSREGDVLIRSKRWSVYSLWREGTAITEHIARCPVTAAVLADRPAWDVPGSGPTVMFSVLDANTRIPPHTGPANTRLVVHLPLIVPPGCGFRVGGQTREWVPGKAFVFNDTIEHEAWNEGSELRVVLIFDIWRPSLGEAERELARALTVSIGEYYAA